MVEMDRKRITNVFRIVMISIIVALIVAPVALMNHGFNVVSDIDNRKLTELPKDGELSRSVLQSYVSDRIGLRKEMIGVYSIINDRVFGLMTHPLYEYGEDGYVFFRYNDEAYDEDFIWAYAEYVLQMQEYCEARNVPFLYVISPEKKRTYEDKMSASVNWQPSSSALLKPIFDEIGVTYIDLNDALVEARNDGIQVFNVAYDAGHWNAEGMYVGVRYIIEKLNEMGVSVEAIDLDDYEKKYTEHTTLPSSYYPIDAVSTFKYMRLPNRTAAHSLDDFSAVVEINPSYKFLQCFENDSLPDGANLLMFQGSYFNSQGTMLQHQFSRANLVHDYQNVLNLPYYYDIFNPDVVVFECADYTLIDNYFSYAGLLEASLPPPFSTWDSLPSVSQPYYGAALEYDPYSVVCNFTVPLPEEFETAYVFVGDRVLDTMISGGISAHFGVATDELIGQEAVELACVSPDGGELLRFQVPLEAAPHLHTKFLVEQYFKNLSKG